jgi:hypothetical protein
MPFYFKTIARPVFLKKSPKKTKTKKQLLDLPLLFKNFQFISTCMVSRALLSFSWNSYFSIIISSISLQWSISDNYPNWKQGVTLTYSHQRSTFQTLVCNIDVAEEIQGDAGKGANHINNNFIKIL